MNSAPESSVRFVTQQLDDRPAGPGAVLYAVGSRSDAVRVGPVIEAVRRLGVRQAVARPAGGPDAPVFGAAGLPLTDELVQASKGSPGERTARILSGFEALLVAARPSVVVVAGDGDSTLACALAASKLGVPIARLGGGLRCHDWSLSEEINRVLSDRLATVLLVDSVEAADTLQAEGIGGDAVHRVGSTVVDSVRRWERDARARGTSSRLGLTAGSYVLATLHRPENVEADVRLARITEGLARLARRVRVIFPMHPRTAAVMEPMGDIARLRDAEVVVTGPLNYLDFLNLQIDAGSILTDSGCVQEEASALGIRCFTLRRSTERAATLTHGTNVLLGDDPDEIPRIELHSGGRVSSAIPYWDGRAADRVAAALQSELFVPVAA